MIEMIDLNELRKVLARHGTSVLNEDEVLELLDHLEAAESEAIEQARLNGMGAERELALMAKLEAAEKERNVLKAKVERMTKRLLLILEEPEVTRSNSKALREVIRQANLALKESK